ncbi:dCTP deaminase [Aeromonas phage BUCT695]|uniref:dCTP deaminase n=1 Tax=Aeromonas phage BUCT695 TaxID=2908630 RepID=UPI0023298931|nr:dCTP deaminase [Aeromonas phage BUCT695]UIW10534.1 2'-deoxycytidine 5'-triphosphate deaminase [Aeromonas phage BUCT695]
MLLSAPQLHQLIDDGVIDALHENVNSASIDVRIGNKILLEEYVDVDDDDYDKPVDIAAKESPRFYEEEIPEEGIVIEPGQCFLAHTVETFNLPDTISGQFIERSTVARCFLEHMQAGWADAGWHGAQLTMEFKNMNQFHSLLIKPGMRIGQMVFFQHEPVGEDSYSVKGNYNNQRGATKAYAGEGHVEV